MATSTKVSVLVYALGLGIAVVGVGLYEAWWTAAFALGGALVGAVGLRQTTPARPLGVGAAASGGALLSGMSVFLVFGAAMGGGTPWLLAAVVSILAAVALFFLARGLLKKSSQQRHVSLRDAD